MQFLIRLVKNITLVYTHAFTTMYKIIYNKIMKQELYLIFPPQ